SAKALSADGNITMNGYGNVGLLLGGTAATQIKSTGAGNLHLIGTAPGTVQGIGTYGPATIESNTGNITIETDRLFHDTTTAVPTIESKGNGSLFIQPRTAATSIGIGGGTGTLILTATQLDGIKDGFKDIFIGHASGSGAINVGTYTFKDNLMIRTPTGNGDITLNGALATGSGSQIGTITLQAGRSIIGTTGGGRSITTQGQNITLNADRDQGTGTDTGGGNIQLTNTAITSNGGAIVLGGGLNPLTTAAIGIGTGSEAQKAGIYLSGGSINAGAGTITLRGTGIAGTDFAYGISTRDNNVIGSTTSTGAITLHGTGGASTLTRNVGVSMTGTSTAIHSRDGDITIYGTGGANGSQNYGIFLSGSAKVQSHGTGANAATITLHGTGGLGTGSSYGTYFSGSGTGAGVSSVDGNITIHGTGGNAGGSNYGIVMTNAAVVESTGTGANAATITLNGTGAGSGGSNHGFYIRDAGAQVRSQDGAITYTGIGSGSSGNGIHFAGGSSVQSTGAAPITVTATGAGTNPVDFYATASATTIGDTTSTGNIAINADTIDWGATALTLRSSGKLFIQPRTATTSIGLGDSAGGILNINAAELNGILDGFSEIVIGHASGSGSVDVRAYTFKDDLTIRTPTGAGSIAINGALNMGTNRLSLIAAGPTTQAAAITAGSLRLGGNGNFTLENAANSVNTVSKDGTGSVSLRNASALAVGSVDGVNGITGSTVDLRALSGNLTLNQGVTGTGAGNAVVLSTTAGFINNAGNYAVQASSGRWLVYSDDPDGNFFGGLNSARHALYGRTIASYAPGSVSETGNRYIFAYTPSLMVSTTLSGSKTYGETHAFPTPVLGANYTVTGFVNAALHGVFLQDTAASIGLGGDPVFGSAGASASAAVGTYGITITQGSLSSTAGYSFGSFVSTGQLNVTQRAITIIPNSGLSKTYGNTDPTLTYIVTGPGLVNGDTLSGALSRALGENVGNYEIGQGTLAASSNYAVTFASGVTFGITPRGITLTANPATKIYGNLDPALGVSIGSGTLAGGDTLAEVTGTVGRESGETVGSYDIQLGTGSKAGNYTIAFDADNNAFTITPRPIVLTADAASKTYGDADPTLGVSLATGSTLATGDTLSDVTGTIGRQSGETVNVYDIQLGTGSKADNYTITFNADNDAFTITPKTINLNGVAANGKTYDGTTAATFDLSGASLSGVLVGDMVQIGTGSGTFASKDAGIGIVVTASGFTLVGADAGNYTLAAQPTGLSANIAPKALTVTANNANRAQDQANPPFSATYSGFVPGEGPGHLSGTLVFGTVSGYVPVGAYAITPSGLFSGNYAITFVDGTLTVWSAPEWILSSGRELLETFDMAKPWAGLLEQLEKFEEREEKRNGGKVEYEQRDYEGAITTLRAGE
ncbi:MAG TPA: MBG domain-containing protein, partial [Bacteroidia bacterium]|nr:MBG domain-containing protein [Bacteroidia bacterium]